MSRYSAVNGENGPVVVCEDDEPGTVLAMAGRQEDVELIATALNEHEQVERYRTAIKTALDTMAVANDEQLGPGGVARKAYAGLWHAYFAIPAGIDSPPFRENEGTK